MSNESVEEYIIEENGKLYRVWDPKITETEIDLGGKEEICRVPFPHPTTEEQQTINKLTIEVWEKEQTIEHFRKQCDTLDGQLWRAEEERDKLKKSSCQIRTETKRSRRIHKRSPKTHRRTT